MKFEVSERFKTSKSEAQILESLEEQFRKISNKVSRNDGESVGSSIVIESIEATFGSINRKDITEVKISKKESGYLCVADVTYNPSVMFWILLIILLFTWIGWLIPIGMYLYHKKIVQEAIEKVLSRVKDEVED